MLGAGFGFVFCPHISLCIGLRLDLQVLGALVLSLVPLGTAWHVPGISSC